MKTKKMTNENGKDISKDHENNNCSRMVQWKPNFRLYTTVEKEAVGPKNMAIKQEGKKQKHEKKTVYTKLGFVHLKKYTMSNSAKIRKALFQTSDAPTCHCTHDSPPGLAVMSYTCSPFLYGAKVIFNLEE